MPKARRILGANANHVTVSPFIDEASLDAAGRHARPFIQRKEYTNGKSR
jgi:hypothetical protein